MEHSSARASIDVGAVIADTYTIEALLGRGGMGAVFLARHNRLPGKQVAIKVLHAEVSSDEVLARFKREAQIASLLSHPNIVHVEDYNVTADGMPYLVLEYLQGESLAQRLRAGPLPLDQVFSIIRQVASALAAAHAKGIVHRDLKPQNIFLVPSELDGRALEIAKVLDFGISKMRDSQTVKTQDTALLGTPQYMAPEQATGQHDRVDARTDVFALGAIVYEMLSGKPAFDGLTIPEVVFKVVYEPPADLATWVTAVPEHVIAAVHRALAKQPDERFDSVASFIEALTGTPLPPTRASLASMPSPAGAGPDSNPRTPNTGQDAFAQTMGSGDHGAAPILPGGAAAAGLVEATAPTVASMHPPSEPPPGAAAGAAASPPSRRRLLVGFAALAAAAATAVVVYVAATPPRHEAAVPREAIAAASSDGGVAVPIDAAPAATASVDAAPAAALDAANADVPLRPTPARARERAVASPPRGKSDAPARAVADDVELAANHDTRAGQRLKAALQALAATDWATARRDAQIALTSEDASRRQRQVAAMILGIVACKHGHDQEAARTYLRQIGRTARALRRRLITACHEVQYLQNERP